MAEIRYRPPRETQWLKAGVGYPVCVWSMSCLSPVESGELPSFCYVLVQLPSHVQLFAVSWTAPCQASLSVTISQSLPSSCPLHQWCNPAISSSDTMFSFCPQSFPESGTFCFIVLGFKIGQMMCQSHRILSCLFKVKNLGFPGGSVTKNLPANAGDMGSIWVGKIS